MDVVGKKNVFWVVVALLSLYLIWGSTYIGIRCAIQTIPPFLMSGTRNLAAGVILLMVLKPDRISYSSLQKCSLSGVFLVACFNGLVSWGEQWIPSGLAALLVATVPIWMSFVGWIAFGERAPSVLAVIGTFVGLSGVALLSSAAFEGNWNIAIACGVVSLAPVGWAIGSFIARSESESPPLLVTAIQLVSGGIVLFAMSAATGEVSRCQWSLVSLHSLLALGYLTLVGSLIGFGAYSWLLRNAPATWVSTFAYVNPLVAVALGYFLCNESVDEHTVAGGLLILGSVVTILLTRRPKLP